MKTKDSCKRGKNSSHNPFDKRISRVMEDENTTNSETSDQTEFSDINWEENIEIDTTEVDEFAPQALPKINRIEEKPVDKTSVPDIVNNHVENKGKFDNDLCDIESPDDFHFGLKLLIMNYKTNEWIEGEVEELDMDEEEVLIRYEQGENSEEWISMKSQRIKKKKEIAKIVSSEELGEVSAPESPAKPQENVSETEQSSADLISQVSQSTVSFHDPTCSSSTSLRSPVPHPPRKYNKVKKKLALKKIKGVLKKPVFKKSKFKPISTTKINQRMQIQVGGKGSRRLPIWKAHSHPSKASSDSSGGSAESKFVEGEKVLAKWSDHRMQKFPAVIKKVVGGGLYDVLFYDGFEKTIAEDNLYKTTDEEMEKYQGSKPSEADSFIDVDISSKHERRQKKRKTFDGFFEEKDFKRQKKVGDKNYDLNRSESFLRASLSRNKPSIQSFSVHNQYIKKLSPTSPKSVHVPQKSTVTPPPKAVNTPSPKASPNALPNKASFLNLKSAVVLTPRLAPELLKQRLSSSPQKSVPEEESSGIEAPALAPTKITPLKDKTKLEIDKSQSKKEVFPAGDAYSLPRPLQITCHDGVVRNSILIEDDKLPFGWTKHVISWVENVWACFLFTPDKYALHSIIELKKYFRISEGREPPEGLDFSYPKESLLEIARDQKDLEPEAHYRKWVNKVLDERKVMKKVRILPPSRSIGPGGHFNTKRVRTLLPKYRIHTFNQSSKAVEGKVWKCPSEDCGKKFRKENLLQMHIKHYHRELSELAGSAPKVSDLALARTSSDRVFTSESTPKRSVPKSPIKDEKSDSAPERESIESLPDQPGTSQSVSVPELKSQASPLPGISSLKILSPVKNSKIRSESDSDNTKDIEAGEKARLHSTPKLSSKKLNEGKPLDKSYLAGSRGFKKKQYIMEKTCRIDVNEPLYEDDSKDQDANIERLQMEEIINCICGFKEEDGLMVQCEICLCWQHGFCHGIEKDSDVPEPYVCTVCLDPLHIRSSQKYSYAKHYLTVSKLPRFNYRTCKEDVLHQREQILSESFRLTSNLQSIHKMERTLTAKINIAQQSDHPKLYLWSANWDNAKDKKSTSNMKKSNLETDKGKRGPVGEAPIESVDCRLRLLDSIESDQQDLESRLTIIQAKLQALESEDFDLGGEDQDNSNGDPLLKQAVYMLLRDLSTISTATSLS